MSDNQEQSGPNELELLKQRAKLMGITHSGNIGVETLRQKINERMAEMAGEEPQSETQASEPENTEDSQDAQEDNSESSEESQTGNFDADIEEEAETPQAPEPEVNGFTAAKQIADAKVTAPLIQPIAPLKPRPVAAPSVSQKIGQPVQVKEGKTLTLRQYMYNNQMKLVRLQITNLDPKKADLQGEVITVANKYLGTVKYFVPYGEDTDDGWHIPYIIYKELERRRFLSIRTTKDKHTKQLKVTKSWAKEFSLNILPPLTSDELARLATAQLAAGSIENPSEVL